MEFNSGFKGLMFSVCKITGLVLEKFHLLCLINPEYYSVN